MIRMSLISCLLVSPLAYRHVGLFASRDTGWTVLVATGDAHPPGGAPGRGQITPGRRALFPKGAAGEVALEMAEGLAEYTGARVALAPGAALERAVTRLREAELKERQARSFAYVTGPALGLLLDEANPQWRKALKGNSDLAALLGQGRPEAAEAAASRYDALAIRQEEEAREAKRVPRVTDLRRRFVDGPVLTVPMGSINFNPSLQEAPEGLGIYNPTLRLVGAWGILTVTDGSLMAENWSTVRVPAPADPAAKSITGPGWSLEFKEGWSLVPGKRTGDWTVGRVTR